MASTTQNAPLSSHPHYIGSTDCKTRFYFQGQITLVIEGYVGDDTRFHVFFGMQTLPVATFLSMGTALQFISDELHFTGSGSDLYN